MLPGYNVRVRLEDFFVAFTIFVFFIQLLRKKIILPRISITIGPVVYLIIGFLSVLSAIFIVGSVPMVDIHIGKTVLHWLRRAEYLSLFFVLFASIKSVKSVKIYLGLIFATLVGVTIYGYGQKYLYWPAFSTMNHEYAKGWWLYLSEHARVLSTFGGHYDLGAYLVITLTLAWSFLFGLKNWFGKIAVGVILSGGFWLLILTASRSSFIGYLAGLSIVCLLWTFRKGLRWGLISWVVSVGLSVLVMLSFGDLSDRFFKLLRLQDRIGVLRVLLLRPGNPPPRNNAVILENNLKAVTSKSDMPPLPTKPGDVVDVPLYIPVTDSSGKTTLVRKERTYSQYALMFDLSTGIRLDATWPRAWEGFMRSPVLGSGYATLQKVNNLEFTQGESTDNDYLRALGETGLLGMVSYFGAVILMAVVALRSLGGLRDPQIYALASAFVGLVVGLLLNALLLDIFEASKVAYAFWGVAGLTMGSLYMMREKIKADYQPPRISFDWKKWQARLIFFLKSDFCWVLVLVVLSIALRSYQLKTPLADWHSWRQADTSAVTRQFIKFQKIDWLYPRYDDLSSVASGKPNPEGLRMVEFPLYNAMAFGVKQLLLELGDEGAGRMTTALLSSLAMVFIFLLCRNFFSRRVAYLSALVYAILPYNIFYGRTILPDPTMTALGLGGVWFGTRFAESNKLRHLILFILFSAAALLVKPYAAFILLPLGYIFFANYKFEIKRYFSLVLPFTFCLLPLVLWRLWISQFPEGIPASDWLFNGDGIRFKGAWLFWLFADRIGRLILGYWGLIPLGFGLIRPLSGKYKYFAICSLLSAILYLVVFATGNVRHDYYQILIVPSLVVMVGLGLDFMISFNKRALAFSVLCSLFSVCFGWYFIRDYYNINHPEIVEAGKVLWERFVGGRHEKALFIAPYEGDTAFLYQTHLRGWPIMEGTISDMIVRGADYYVSVKFDETTKKIIKDAYPGWIPKQKGETRPYKLLAINDKYVIVQLIDEPLLPGNY